MPTPIIQDLLTLSHEIGREDRGLAILGEGNTSARLSEETFAVKASGNFLYSLVSAGIVMVWRPFSPAPQINETLTLLPGVPRR